MFLVMLALSKIWDVGSRKVDVTRKWMEIMDQQGCKNSFMSDDGRDKK